MTSKTEAYEQSLLMERGRHLKEIASLPGWNDALNVLEELVVEAEADLMNCRSSDNLVLLGLQKRANAYRTLFHQFQRRVQDAIQVLSVPKVPATDEVEEWDLVGGPHTADTTTDPYYG